MPSVIDISKTHGMGTARAIEQFGFPRSLRKFITDHIDWLTTKVYLNETPDVERVKMVVSQIIKVTPFLRSRHVIDGDRDLLFFEDYDPNYDYLANGTEMFKIRIFHTSLIISSSHVVTDLNSCYRIGKDIENLYYGGTIDTEIDQMKVFNEFTKLFANQVDITRKPSKWRLLKLSVNKIEDSFTKEEFIFRDMKAKGLQTMEFEEIYNTARLFKSPVRGCTTIATIKHVVTIDENATDIANFKKIEQTIQKGCNLNNVVPDTYTTKYIYNFIRTDKMFYSVLTHMLMSSAEFPSFIYNFFGFFIPMKNDTTEEIKIVFQNSVFGSIVVNIKLH